RKTVGDLDRAQLSGIDARFTGDGPDEVTGPDAGFTTCADEEASDVCRLAAITRPLRRGCCRIDDRASREATRRPAALRPGLRYGGWNLVLDVRARFGGVRELYRRRRDVHDV